MEKQNLPPEKRRPMGGILSVVLVVLFVLAVIAILYIIDFLFEFK